MAGTGVLHRGVRLLGEVTLAAVQVDRALMRGRERGRSFVRGLMTEALSPEELEELMVQFYVRGPNRFTRAALEEWEAQMFDRWLPPPPAKVLVTAAGSGREARALVERGYAVDALEPVPAMAATCAALEGVDTVVCATHEDLIAAVADGRGPARALTQRDYDAVLVGWGSLNHIFSRERQVSLLSACDRLASSGPVLISFFARRRPPAERERALAAGRCIGRCFRAARKGSSIELDVSFAWNVGFTHPYTVAEIEGLASSIGRVAETELTPYGHAVLRRVDAAQA